jgi:predicted metal-dependent hydrolase
MLWRKETPQCQAGAVKDHSITIRRLSLRFPATCDPVIVDGRPEESYLYVGLSLLLPYLEPYLIRTMRSAKKLIRDPALVADTEAFIGQESQHYKLHMQFNRSLDLKKYEGLKELEDMLANDYRRFSESSSLRFNLAYAEGFEAFTMAVSRFMLRIRALDRVQPEIRDLFCWHLVEELEHRTVTFDVYQHVCRGFFHRLRIGLFAQWHMCGFVLGVARLMKRAEGQGLYSRFGGRWGSCKRVGALLGLAVLHLLPKLVNTHMPWYSPHHIDMPEDARAFAAEYTERARSRGAEVEQ